MPGDVATDVLSSAHLTSQQFRELAIYPPCPSCRRSLWRIARQGCPHGCSSLARAQALLGPLEMFEVVRSELEHEQAADDDGARRSGRGTIEPIPEWGGDRGGAPGGGPIDGCEETSRG